MALKIIDDCICCGLCVEQCPNDAISEGDPIYVIDPARCTECVGFFSEPQCVKVCPVDVIVQDPEHVETQEELLEKKKRLHGE
ncbi:MAG: YfhL family 4Fe-4S dicluster ferredoxin [Bacteroidales bacterium]|nr:YfhL family 4Fe-4S dicluster ferredoxin [Bacteroidales bacterium]MBN2632385.1 YfhL family 4Fe-4S dicluster ferredoxin [Bacteroidales bacterium]